MTCLKKPLPDQPPVLLRWLEGLHVDKVQRFQVVDQRVGQFIVLNVGDIRKVGRD